MMRYYTHYHLQYDDFYEGGYLFRHGSITMDEIIEKFEHCTIAKSPCGLYVLSPHKFRELKSSKEFEKVILIIAKKKIYPCEDCKDRLKEITGLCDCYFYPRIRWHKMEPDLKDFCGISPILCMKDGPDFRRYYFQPKELDIREETVEQNRKIAMSKLKSNKYTQDTVDSIKRMLEQKEVKSG